MSSQRPVFTVSLLVGPMGVGYDSVVTRWFPKFSVGHRIDQRKP